MDRIKQNLKALCLATGVSGLENEASIVASKLLSQYTDTVSIDHFGNVVGLIQSSNKAAKTVLLDAHIDEIGMVVTAIDDKGFVKFANCGGVDRRLLSAQIVTIHGKKDIVGVVGSKPPHLETKEEASKIAELSDMFIDIGYDKETALEYISLGDKISIPSEFVEMLNDRVSCKAIDDRGGVCVILEALELLKGKDLPVNVAIQFTSREEVGGQGAKVASYTASPDMAIAVDVSFALTPDAVEHKCGKMGEGVMIGYHAILDKEFSDKLLAIAKEKEIKYQIEVMGGRSTGTNADGIILTKAGVRTSVLSIPLKYMHTPIEQVALCDIEETAKLIAEFLQNANS
ncbi:MAG: M20/M25/M40 family metallo-hydrolase [Oscillospiraceae bacterium]